MNEQQPRGSESLPEWAYENSARLASAVLNGGYVDDAIHCRRHWWSRKTLCGLPAKPRRVLSPGSIPDFWAGCWTCRHEAVKERLARPHYVIKAIEGRPSRPRPKRQPDA